LKPKENFRRKRRAKGRTIPNLSLRGAESDVAIHAAAQPSKALEQSRRPLASHLGSETFNLLKYKNKMALSVLPKSHFKQR
jgi:hypothetical protein